MSQKSKSLSSKTTTTISLLALMRIVVTIFSVLSIFVLAKLLTPEDFGLVAMASILAVALQQALQIPVNQVLILIDEPRREDFNTAFTLNVIRGLIMFLLLVGSAYPMSIFYGESEVTYLALAFSIPLLLSGFENPTLIMLEKELQVKKIVFMNIFAQLVGILTSIYLAWLTQSYWAMVWGNIANQIVRLVMTYSLRPYLPGFSLSKWRSMMSFSVWLTFSKVLLTLTEKLDQILIGKLFGSASLGHFNIGNEIARRPTLEFAGVLNRGLFPAFSQLKHERQRLLSAYNYSIGYCAAFAIPLGMGLTILAEPFVLLFLGQQWSDAIIVVQVLAAAVAFSTIDGPTRAILMAKGKTKLIFRRDVFFALTKTLLVILGVIYFGILGILIGIAIGRIIVILINWFVMNEVFEVSFAHQIRLVIRPVLSSFIMACVLGFALNSIEVSEALSFNQWLFTLAELLIHVIIGALVYVFSHFTLWIIMRKPYGPEEKLLKVISKYK